MDLAALTNTVLDFIRQHPNWAAVFVFGLAFGESLPFASLVLPFWAVLVGVGAIIAVADPLIFWTIVVAAAIGAALGDWLSYWVGYHYHAQLQQMWPLNKYPKLLNSGRSFFKRWGALGIVISRFSGPLRASVPIVAGIAEMPWLRFQLANWSSAFLWAFVLLSPGAWGLKWWTQHIG
jgi:membrane protein DedA with SNARE-associated domain